jgi:hypothetical protein
MANSGKRGCSVVDLLLLLVFSRNNRETLQTSFLPSTFQSSRSHSLSQSNLLSFQSTVSSSTLTQSPSGLFLAGVKRYFLAGPIPETLVVLIFPIRVILPQVACHGKWASWRDQGP